MLRIKAKLRWVVIHHRVITQGQVGATLGRQGLQSNSFWF